MVNPRYLLVWVPLTTSIAVVFFASWLLGRAWYKDYVVRRLFEDIWQLKPVSIWETGGTLEEVWRVQNTIREHAKAVRAVGRCDVVATQLVPILREDDVDIRRNVVLAFREWGHEASGAIPLLEELIASDDEDLKDIAGFALDEIDFEAARRGGCALGTIPPLRARNRTCCWMLMKELLPTISNGAARFRR